MTTTEAPSDSCARCATPRRTGARFCPACGERLAPAPITFATASLDPATGPIPLPRPAPDASPDASRDASPDASPDATPDAATPAAGTTRARRGATGLVVACALVTVAAVVTTVALLVGGPAPVTTATPVSPVIAAPATAAAPKTAPKTAPRTAPARSAAPAGVVPVVGWSGWTPGGTGYGTARPSELDADGDGTSVVEDITWQTWGGATATGRGTATWVPPTGSLADGVEMQAVVVASDLGDCHGRLGYRTVGWYFPSKGETAPRAGYDRICRAP